MLVGLWPAAARARAPGVGGLCRRRVERGKSSQAARSPAAPAAVCSRQKPLKKLRPAPALTAEGVLKAALAELWEKARKGKYVNVKVLNVRLFDAVDAFRMIGSVNAEKGCTKHVQFSGDYVTQDGSELSITFKGNLPAARCRVSRNSILKTSRI